MNACQSQVVSPALTLAMSAGRAVEGLVSTDGGFAARDFYLYWSIERVAMVYDLKFLAGKEWYSVLSKLLVEAQMEDGGWDPAAHNTCFALLVLRRVNVAKDLTSSLKASLSIKDLNLQIDPDAAPMPDKR